MSQNGGPVVFTNATLYLEQNTYLKDLGHNIVLLLPEILRVIFARPLHFQRHTMCCINQQSVLSWSIGMRHHCPHGHPSNGVE
jgi:hypothetical protein